MLLKKNCTQTYSCNRFRSKPQISSHIWIDIPIPAPDPYRGAQNNQAKIRQDAVRFDSLEQYYGLLEHSRPLQNVSRLPPTQKEHSRTLFPTFLTPWGPAISRQKAEYSVGIRLACGS